MRRLIFFACIFAIASQPAISADCGIHFLLDKNAKFSAEEISHLSAEPEVFKNKNGSLVINFFDDNFLPSRDSRKVVLIFYASSGDLDARSIGGTILEKGPLSTQNAVSGKVSREGDNITYTLNAAPSGICPAQKTSLTFDASGNLYVDKMKLGNVSE